MKVVFKNVKKGTYTLESNIIRITKESIDGIQFYVLQDSFNCEICFPMGQYKLHRVEE